MLYFLEISAMNDDAVAWDDESLDGVCCITFGHADMYSQYIERCEQ